MLLSFELSFIFLWIGCWGLIETLISSCVDDKHYRKRITIYIVLIFLAFIIYRFFGGEIRFLD